MLIRMINGHRKLKGIIRRSERPLTPRLQSICKDVILEMKIKTPVSFAVSREISSPVFAGVFHPFILIPKELDSEDHACDARWILRHELTHYKMLDPLAQLVRQAAQVLFFFHPCVWLASHKWEEAAEFACDRAVIRNAEDAEFYSRALSRIVETIRTEKKFSFASGLFMAKTRIGKRIAALLDSENAAPPRLSAIQIMIIGILSASILFTGFHFATAETTSPTLKSQIKPPASPLSVAPVAQSQYAIQPKSADEAMNAYMDDFNDTRIKRPAGWEIIGASDEKYWYLENGGFNTGNGDDMRTKDGWSFALYKGNSPVSGDYTVSVNFKMLQGNGAVAIIMSWKDADNHYRGLLRLLEGHCSMIIEKVENGIAETISQKPLDLKEIPHGEHSQFEKLSMQIADNSISLTFKNHSIKSNDNNIQGGYAGLGEWYNSIIYDDFVLAVNMLFESPPAKEESQQTTHWNHFILFSRGMSLSKATELREQYATIFGDIKIIIKAEEQNGFNLLIGPFSNESDVWAACQILKQKNIPYSDIVNLNNLSETQKAPAIFVANYKPDNKYAMFNVLINEFQSDKKPIR